MPIKPENMAKYPGGSIRSPEWLAIRERIRERAGDKCEQCGIGNHEVGYRQGDEWRRITEMPNIWVGTTSKTGEKIIMIVCTVAHVDGDLVDHSDDNLRFWCQRCHNRHDAKQRRANAARTIAAKSGQIGMTI